MENHFELFLAKHCAPLLLGKKAAVLFAKKCLPKHCDWAELESLGFKIIKIQRRHQGSLLFIYEPTLLSLSLGNSIAIEKLAELGYPVQDGVIGMLDFLKSRFDASPEFPHEVGFFLDYPPEDVIGFMNCNKQCKLCGQWKVYGNEEQARHRFAEFERCRALLLSHFEKEGSLFLANLPALAG